MRKLLAFGLFGLLIAACAGCPKKVAPTAAFSGTPASGKAPLTVQFTDGSTNGSAPIGQWAWNFGDGQSSSERNPAHAFGAGTFTVSLTVTSADGSDTETKSGYIQVQAAVPPTASFTATPTTGIAPLSVSFDDTSSPGSAAVVSRLWNFGDGQSSNDANPVHIYAHAGVYDVSLTVTTADGADTITRDNCIEVFEASEPYIAPDAGVPSAMVRIFVPGDVLDTGHPGNNLVYFDDKAMLPANVTSRELTTAVPPLAAAGAVVVRVTVGGVEVASNLSFTVLPSPGTGVPAGTVAADVRNEVVDMMATTLNQLKPVFAAMDAKSDSGIQGALAAVEDQMHALQPLMDYARENDELELLDEVLVNCGFADEIRNINQEFKKRMAAAKAMDALALDEGAKTGDRFLPARYRFVLDYLGAHLHLAMEFANVGMVALSTAATFSPAGTVAFGGAAAYGNILMAMVNMMVVFIEAVPVDLEPESLAGTVGARNTLATNSQARAVFMGTFVSEKNMDQTVFALFMPGLAVGLADELHIPEILLKVFEKVGEHALASAEHPEEHKHIIPPLPPDPDMPIYAFEFLEKLSSNPPAFDAGSVADLDVKASMIYSHDEEGGPFNLEATQRVYKFEGGFFAPGDPPRIEKEQAECTVPVMVKRGIVLTLNEPQLPDPLPPPGELLAALVSGHVENWDGSPADDGKVTITVEVLGQTYVTHPTGGDFQEEISVPPGKTTVTVTGDDGKTSATKYVIVLNAALPPAYCVVTNYLGNSLSLVDAKNEREIHRVESADVGNALNGPRDGAFLPDGETLLLVNSAAQPNIAALRLVNIAAISALSAPLPLGGGKCNALALTPDSKSALIPCYNGASALHVVDVRQPDSLRVAQTVDCATWNAYGAARVCTGTVNGRTVALVTTGNFSSSGPTKLLVFDVTNPYNVSAPGVVEVPTSGAAVAAVPGTTLAVIAGTTYYNAGTQKVDGAVAVIDFGDPLHPRVRGKIDKSGSYLFGLAVTADRTTAYVTDAGNPLSPANKLLRFDISNPDVVTEKRLPLSFGGTGCVRMALSPDGQEAVVAVNLSDAAVVIDLSNPAAPVAGERFDLGDQPYGIIFQN